MDGEDFGGKAKYSPKCLNLRITGLMSRLSDRHKLVVHYSSYLKDLALCEITPTL
jgi:hypothetical protein